MGVQNCQTSGRGHCGIIWILSVEGGILRWTQDSCPLMFASHYFLLLSANGICQYDGVSLSGLGCIIWQREINFSDLIKSLVNEFLISQKGYYAGYT
jgi:hypothetical protein